MIIKNEHSAYEVFSVLTFAQPSRKVHVQDQVCWNADCTVKLPKQRHLQQSSLTFLCLTTTPKYLSDTYQEIHTLILQKAS